VVWWKTSGLVTRLQGVTITAFRLTCAPVAAPVLLPESGILTKLYKATGLGCRRQSPEPAVVLGSRVGNGFQDLDGAGTAVRQRVGMRSAAYF
jgi:hypothetical protein